VKAWKNDTKTRENHDKFDKNTKLLTENKPSYNDIHLKNT